MSNDSDFEDAQKHNALLDDIRALNQTLSGHNSAKKKLCKTPKKVSHKVRLNDLLASIKSTRNVGELKRKLEGYEDAKEYEAVETSYPNLLMAKKKFRKGRASCQERESAASKMVLATPLTRHVAQRLESKILYNDFKDEVRPWGSVIHKNRVAEVIHFPLGEDSKEFTARKTTSEKAVEFEPKTELERLTAEILSQSKFNIRNNEQYCEAEKEIIKSLNIKEAKKRCEELQKMRALISYKGIKLKQQAKIKSKQYHRIHKREKRRKLLKEIESLLVKDPETAAEKLKNVEMDRVYERATLKHRGLNKWSREMKQFAARNPQARQILDIHLRLGRELKSHTTVVGNFSDDDNSEKKITVGEIVELAAEQAGKEFRTTNSALIMSTENPFLKSAFEAVQEERRLLAEKARQRGAELPTLGSLNYVNEESKKRNDVLVLESKTGISLPDELLKSLSCYDTEMQNNFLAQAYENDNVFAEFENEKQRVEEAEQPKAIDKNLSGWGSWTGPGIVDRKRKNLICEPKKLERRDAGWKRLIIRESISKGIADYQPRDVPFPFTSVQDYETYVRQPLGRDWSAATAQNVLVCPKIQTLAGRIIRPMNKSAKNQLESEDSD